MINTTHSSASSSSQSSLFTIGQNLLQTIWLPSFTKKKEELLLQAGICDPKVFYQTEKKTAEIFCRLLEVFQSKGLHLTYDKEEKEFIAYDSTLSDIDEVNKELSQGYHLDLFSQELPLFYLYNQTIYCKVEKCFFSYLKLTTPPAQTWSLFLNFSRKNLIQDFQEIQLPSGKTLSQEAFVNHPLFQNTLEKYNVFRFLPTFITKPHFQEQYNQFLETVSKETWFEPYLSDPKTLDLFF